MIPADQIPLLVTSLKLLIEKSRERISKTVNQEMTTLYWNIGKIIHDDILKNEKPSYGEQITKKIGIILQNEYGNGFSPRVLQRTVQFYKSFPDFEMASTLSTQLTWSHFVELLPIQDPLKRNFYAEMCKIDSWSVRTLREKIGKMLYERTAISKEPDSVISDSLDNVNLDKHLNPKMILQNPYVLDFLNLPKTYNESTLEQAILDEIQRFLLEIGSGFCFVERQKRITVGDADYYIDLLLYNRYLRRMVAIELKTTKFKPAHKGQIEFYLKWLDKNEKRGDDLPPIGIVLCAGKSQQVVELFDLAGSDIHIAEYWTELPSKHLLEQKIHDVIEQRANMLEDNKKNWDLDDEDEN